MLCPSYIALREKPNTVKVSFTVHYIDIQATSSTPIGNKMRIDLY